MYLSVIEGSKTPVRLTTDMGYRIIANIIEIRPIGIVFRIIESDHEDYPVNKNIFISSGSDCSFIEI